MRMWNVNPKCMCDNHLLGEHFEIHMFVGSINKNKQINGYLKNGLLEVHNLEKRHNELAREMKNRNMNHKSKLKKYKKIKAGKIDVQRNIQELKKRCNKCKTKIKKCIQKKF